MNNKIHHIAYQKAPGGGYKLYGDEVIELSPPPAHLVPTRNLGEFITESEYVSLGGFGLLYLKDKYLTDGISFMGLTNDQTMLAAYTHDGIYQLIRMGALGADDETREAWRKYADKEFYRILKLRRSQEPDKKKRMPRWILWLMYRVVRFMGDNYTTEKYNQDVNKIYIA